MHTSNLLSGTASNTRLHPQNTLAKCMGTFGFFQTCDMCLCMLGTTVRCSTLFTNGTILPGVFHEHVNFLRWWTFLTPGQSKGSLYLWPCIASGQHVPEEQHLAVAILKARKQKHSQQEWSQMVCCHMYLKAVNARFSVACSKPKARAVLRPCLQSAFGDVTDRELCGKQTYLPSMKKTPALLMRQCRGFCSLAHCCAKSLMDCKEAMSSSMTSAQGLLLPCCFASASKERLMLSPLTMFRQARMTGDHDKRLLQSRCIRMQQIGHGQHNTYSKTAYHVLYV